MKGLVSKALSIAALALSACAAPPPRDCWKVPDAPTPGWPSCIAPDATGCNRWVCGDAR
jgi:hypothetical protein